MNLSPSAKVCLLFLAVFGGYTCWNWARGFSHSALAAASGQTLSRSVTMPAPASAEAIVQPPVVPSASRRVPYEITREWPIGVNGVGRNIGFTKPAAGLTGDTLRALGETLRADTAALAQVHIMIFSDVRAARLQPKWAEMKTSKAETALCDAAYVGLYDRNSATGDEKLDCTLGGINNKQLFTVDYHDLPLPSAVARNH